MDEDVSTKFIGSISKHLQTLCNGYIDFSSWVQVTGHLYVSLDTGKIDEYLLNEKLTKPLGVDSVVFSSRSTKVNTLDNLHLEVRSQ